MANKIETFKNYIEEVAKANYDDYDAVEYLDTFSCADYNNAVRKIHKAEETDGFAPYDLLFTEEEMLTVSIMYACIRTGAIASEMTKVLNDNWEQFERELDEMAFGCGKWN